MSRVGPGHRSGGRRAGFTFIEVIACILVLIIGLGGVVGLVLWGQDLATTAQGRATAMPTAISVAMDDQPLLAPSLASSWTAGSYDLDGTGPLTATATGYLNGYYVVRTETSGDADVVARDASSNRVYARTVGVRVDVYDTVNGTIQASYDTHYLRQSPTP
jgi:hypothetical protein